MKLKPLLLNLLIALLLFSLAFWLRVTDLTHFVTADEHNWVYRSGLFLGALLQGDWAGTSVWLTPGVTTTWLGSLGLSAYYQTYQTIINQPLAEWALSFPRNRIDLDVLLYLRWAMALFTSAMTVVVYGLARKLWSLPIVLLGTLFALLSPHLLAVSRIIGHDAPVTFFSISALLAFLVAKRELATNSKYKFWLLLSGVFAGLAVLSKATALFLLPFVALIALVDVWQNRNRLKSWLIGLTIWGAALWLTFILAWPAAWMEPLRQTWAVISNAFLSSAGIEDPDIQPFWSIPDLGAFYYLVNGAFKLSPLVMVGLGLAAVKGTRGQGVEHATRNTQYASAVSGQRSAVIVNELLWLLLYALLFGVFMTFGVKKSPRYILPAFPALAFVAAWGWLTIVHRYRIAVVLGVSAAALLLTLNYAPYYLAYFNPLLGGAYTAPKIVRIGWGEGLDEAGRWLTQKPDSFADRLGARYTVAIAPFYRGEIASPVRDELDYVAFYIKQTQSGYPAPEILAYFEHQGALHRVKLNGVEYAQIYNGPAMQLVKGVASPDLPIAFRPHTIYAPIGEPLTVDLLWRTDIATDAPVTLNLSGEGLAASLDSSVNIQTLAEGVLVSQHHFSLSSDLPRSDFALSLDGEPIGQLKARLMTVPPSMTPASHVFANQVKLAGWEVNATEESISVNLAWQAFPKASNDYTVFVQALNQNGDRVAGVDALPPRGFTTLDRKEVMLTHYTLPLPANLPAGEYTLLAGLYYFAGDELVNIGQTTVKKSINFK